MCSLICISRRSDISRQVLEEYADRLRAIGGRVTVADAKPLELSSTELRERLEFGLDCSPYLDPGVSAYINKKNLYCTGDNAPMGDKKKYSEYKELIKQKLSKKRYTHSVNVADAAVKLAKRYGADADKACIAGLLHDVCKELPTDEQLALVNQCELDVSEVELSAPPLFHAVAGAVYVKQELGIDDPEIIRAIRYHTVACGNMDKLSKIIYIADLISDERDYKDVKKMRKYAEQGLDKAMLEALKFSITDSVAKGNTIPVCTLEAYNDHIKAERRSEKEDQHGRDNSEAKN